MLINLNEEIPPVQEIPDHTPKSFDDLKEIDWQAYSSKLLKEEFDKNQFRVLITISPFFFILVF